MKKKLCCLLIITALIFTGCNSEELEKYTDMNYFLGTIINLTIYHDDKDEAEQHFENMFQIIDDMENVLSKNIDTSEITEINNNAGIKPVKVSEETLELIIKSQEYAEISEGKFDITIGPLVNLWDIGGDNAKVPSDNEIDEVLPLVNYEYLNIDEEENTVMLMKENMEIDLGGIAKGYLADLLAEYMEENNINHGIINLGGNIVTVGGKPDNTSYRIGLQNPVEERGIELGIIEIDSGSIVTSGVYERYLEQDGVKYHHLMDPDTGYPIESELVSCTIISDYSTDGDALSTSIFAFGLDKGLEYIENTEGIEAIFVTVDNEIYYSTGVEEIFTLTDDNYTVVKK